MLGSILVSVFVLASIAAGVFLSRLQSRTRRRFVLEHLESMNLTPLKCVRSFQPLRPGWNRYYWVVAQDGEGHMKSGLAAATGRVRRKTWINWTDDQPASALEAVGRALGRPPRWSLGGHRADPSRGPLRP
jgi:hypothetical protein